MSGVGKGVTTASIGKILKEHGYSVTAIKIDPYLNYDAGTLATDRARRGLGYRRRRRD